MHDLVRQFVDWYLGALDEGGYALIALLMALESSVVPLPSEVVIPPAAHLAHTRGDMSVPGVVVDWPVIAPALLPVLPDWLLLPAPDELPVPDCAYATPPISARQLTAAAVNLRVLVMSTPGK